MSVLTETERAKLRGAMADLRSAAEGADAETTRHALRDAQAVIRSVEEAARGRLAPRCKACGGSGLVPSEAWVPEAAAFAPESKPCPNCVAEAP